MSNLPVKACSFTIPPLDEAKKCLRIKPDEVLSRRIATLFRAEQEFFKLAEKAIPLERYRKDLSERLDQRSAFTQVMSYGTYNLAPTFTNKTPEGWLLFLLTTAQAGLSISLNKVDTTLMDFERDPDIDKKTKIFHSICRTTDDENVYNASSVFILRHQLTKTVTWIERQKDVLDKITAEFHAIFTGTDERKLRTLFPLASHVWQIYRDVFGTGGFGLEDMEPLVTFATSNGYIGRQQLLFNLAKLKDKTFIRDEDLYDDKWKEQVASLPTFVIAPFVPAKKPPVEEKPKTLTSIKSEGQKWLEQLVEHSRKPSYTARVTQWMKIGDDLEKIRSFEGYRDLPDGELEAVRLAHDFPKVELLLEDETFLKRYANVKPEKNGKTSIYLYGSYNEIPVVFSFGLDLKGKIYHKYASPPEEQGGRDILSCLTPGIPTFDERFEQIDGTHEYFYNGQVYTFDELGTISIEDTTKGNKMILNPIRMAVEVRSHS